MNLAFLKILKGVARNRFLEFYQAGAPAGHSWAGLGPFGLVAGGQVGGWVGEWVGGWLRVLVGG